MPRNQPTFGELRTEVRRYLEDPNVGLWTDAEVNRNLNRAILRVWIDTEWEFKTATFTGRTNQSWYYLPTDCLFPRVIIATSWSNEKFFPTDLIQMDREQGSWELDPNSIPSRFIPYSFDRFYIWPPVNANGTAGRTFTIEYVPVPLTVSSDSSVTLGAASTTPPLYISNLIPIKAAQLCWLRQSWQKAREYGLLYKQLLADAQRTIRTTSGAHTNKLRPAGKFERAHSSTKFRLRL